MAEQSNVSETESLPRDNHGYLIRCSKKHERSPEMSGQLRITKPPPYGLCFQKSEFRDQLKADLESFGPDLVIIDPWNSIVRDDKSRDYLETYHLVRQVVPAGDSGPALGIAAHVRKPQANLHAHGRALLYELAGSHVLGTIPRCVWVMEHASDEVDEDRVVMTCAKNNDGALGDRNAWVRQNGIFEPVKNFDWKRLDDGDKARLFTYEEVPLIWCANEKVVARDRIMEKGVSRRTAYRRIQEAVEARLIRFDKGKDGYVLT